MDDEDKVIKTTTRAEEFDNFSFVLTNMAERAEELEENRIAAVCHVLSGAIGRFVAGGLDDHLTELANMCAHFASEKHNEAQEKRIIASVAMALNGGSGENKS